MEELSQLKIGFIGAGKITSAIVTGFLNYGNLKAEQLIVSAPSTRNLDEFSALGCVTTQNNDDLFTCGPSNCDVVFLCVKPQVLVSLAEDQPFVCFNSAKPSIVVSVVAGVDLKRVEQLIVKNGVASREKPLVIYRTVPNTACRVGQGVWGVCRRQESKHDVLVDKLLSTVALVEFVPENAMDAFIGVAGSGIALGYEFIQSMADGAVKMGLHRELATKLAAKALMGAASMVLRTNRHPIELRDDVCSAAGTTIHGIHALQRNAVSSGIMDAVQAAAERSKQLNSQ